jgi:hypothetical protein
MEPPNMGPQQPIQAAVSDLQKTRLLRLGWRQKFFNTFKNKYPNLHILYVLINIIAIWSGIFTIAESWALGINLLTAPAPELTLQKFLRFFCFLVVGLLMLLLDDLSVKELMFGRKTLSAKPIEEMNSREKFFHQFKTKYTNLSTIYTLVAIVLCWCCLWGWFYNIPMQPLVRAVTTICLGFFLLYIDDMSLDEL